MPYEPAGATPMNMGTQCQNIDAENQNTSDPLLKVVLWIAYLTEVSYFHMRDVIDSSCFYTDWCNSHWIRAPYLLYLSSDCAVWLSIIWGLILGWWCNGLVLPPLVVGQTSTTPSPWDPTGKGGTKKGPFNSLLGKDDISKTDEFLEKFQTAFVRMFSMAGLLCII